MRDVVLCSRLTLVACLAMGGAQVHAVQSGVDASTVRAALTDLDLRDGIKPSLNFNVNSWQGRDLTLPTDVIGWDLDLGWEPRSGTGAFQSFRSDSSVFGRTTGAGQSYTVYNPLVFRQAELAPHTALTLTLPFEMFGTPSTDGLARLYLGAICRLANGWDACPTPAGWTGEATVAHAFTEGGLANHEGSVMLRFRNEGAGYARVMYGAELATSGSTITSVPEPATWALMAGGLALVAGVGRRPAARGRQQRAV